MAARKKTGTAKKKRTTKKIIAVRVPEVPKSIKFHFIKGSNFRAVHVDGAFGGITPSAYIHMAVYSERAAIPRELEHEMKEDGTLGDEIGRESREGVVRELEFDMIFDAKTAIAIRDWLDDKINALAELSGARESHRGRRGKKRNA